jgi:hypothetical protein
MFMLALRFRVEWLRIACALLSVFGVVTLWFLVIRAPRRISADFVEVAEVQDEGGLAAGFLASYLLPFLTVPEPSLPDIFAYLVFLVVAAIVYVRSDMAQVNPTLYLFGYLVVSIRTTGDLRSFAIVRRRPLPGDRIRKVSLSNTVFVEVPSPTRR